MGDGGVSNGGLIHRVGSLTKMVNGSEHDEHLNRGDSMRSSVNYRHHRRTSAKNGLLDHKRPSYPKHGRYVITHHALHCASSNLHRLESGWCLRQSHSAVGL